MSIESIPAIMKPGEERTISLEGAKLVLVGTYPAGYTAVLEEESLRLIRAWKLTKLRVIRGQVHACSGGIRPLAARVLTNTVHDCSRNILYRDGNPFNLRRSNLIAVPNHLLRAARLPQVDPATLSPCIRLKDGRVRARAKPPERTPKERLEGFLRG